MYIDRKIRVSYHLDLIIEIHLEVVVAFILELHHLLPVLEWNDKAELVTREPFQFTRSCHWRPLLLFRTVARLSRPTVEVQGCHHHQTQAYQDTYQHSPHLALVGILVGNKISGLM